MKVKTFEQVTVVFKRAEDEVDIVQVDVATGDRGQVLARCLQI